MVYGDKRPALVALLVPEADFLRDWAKDQGKSRALAEVYQDPDLLKALGPAVDRVNKKLANLEKRAGAKGPDVLRFQTGAHRTSAGSRRQTGPSASTPCGRPGR
jgi:long-subunit acyl-CoA synthetase (AMP-forming)